MFSQLALFHDGFDSSSRITDKDRFDFRRHLTETAVGQCVARRALTTLRPAGNSCEGQKRELVMKTRRQLSFKLPELLLLFFEMSLGTTGVLMLIAAVRGNPAGMDLPAHAMIRLLPVVMCVGFAAWLVFRLKCLGQAQSRRWGQVGAVCLTFVALGFGGAVGRLGMVTMSAPFRGAFDQLLADPVTREAAETSYFSFLWIGLVFGITFFLRVGTRRFQTKSSSEALHAQLDEIGRSVVSDWSEQLVTRIDRLLTEGKRHEAVRIYGQETGCDLDEASLTIADWDAHRLRLQIDLLRASLISNDAQSNVQPA